MEKVLIAVNDKSSAISLSTRLSSSGYSISLAHNGREVLDFVEKNQIHLIIMDSQMPVLSGIEACALLRSRAGYLPVILFNGNDSMEDKIIGFNSGADECLSVPVNNDVLMARIGSLIARKHLFDEMGVIIKDIDNLASHTTDIMHQNQLEKFNYEEEISQLIEKYLCNGSHHDYKANEFIIISSPSSLRADNKIFWKEDGKMKESPFLLPETVRKNIPRKELIIRKSNDIIFKSILQDNIQAICGKSFFLNNIFAYMGESIGVIGLNFHGIHENLGVTIFKEIALIIHFLKTISAKIKETEGAFRYLISSLVRASEAHDDETGNHVLRVNEYSKYLAECLGLSKDYISDIYYSAQMHDIGKIMIPSEIIRKPAKLTKEEFDIVKRHTTHGAKILGTSAKLTLAREVALFHHERWDGTGYPYGLKGECIPISGRIVMLADVYDALRSKRAYKSALDHETAVAAILEGDERAKPNYFDPQVLSIFKQKANMFDDIFKCFGSA